MERIIEGYQTAYCPKFDEDRRIKIRFIELATHGASKHYQWTYFNCLEQNHCEHFNRLSGCPFVAEAESQLD